MHIWGLKIFKAFACSETIYNHTLIHLISKRNKICPIEVKSSGYKTHASIDEFIKKFSSKTGERYLIYTKDSNHICQDWNQR